MSNYVSEELDAVDDESTSTFESVSAIACHWTTIFGIEVSPEQVMRAVGVANAHLGNVVELRQIVNAWNEVRAAAA